ncbi:MAG: peptide chain release factor-like protein [Candidatus Omnitrophica bacterium]|nr:peptide chain release factor-like protein [Candidatus Omnitrophota bacterium]
MVNLGVSPEKEAALRERMRRFNIREDDLKENFVRSQGPGGQNVNKTSTCVYLKHIPSGIEVKCQEERSQVFNRYRARVILTGKIESKILGRLSEERKRIEKIRRQKRKRSKRAKLKVLEAKRRQAEKKSLRQRVDTKGEF